MVRLSPSRVVRDVDELELDPLTQILGPPSSRLRRSRGSSGVGRCAKGSRSALAAGFVGSNSVASFSVPGLQVVYRPT
jgi:hypothetical protein